MSRTEKSLMGRLIIQLEKAIVIIDGEYPESQHAEYGLPAMKNALEEGKKTN